MGPCVGVEPLTSQDVRDLPERVYLQEYEAQFLDDAGGVFRRVMEAATLQPQGSVAGRQYVMGVDWARDADFTVLTVMDVASHEMVYMDRFNQVDYVVQRGRLQALAERYNVQAIIAESNSIGEPIIEQLQMPNVGIVYNFHHGHGHLARFPELMRKMQPHLLAINLNGMVTDGDKLELRPVEIGLKDFANAQVLEGLAKGEANPETEAEAYAPLTLRAGALRRGFAGRGLSDRRSRGRGQRTRLRGALLRLDRGRDRAPSPQRRGQPEPGQRPGQPGGRPCGGRPISYPPTSAPA